jgi:hypothetical protein
MSQLDAGNTPSLGDKMNNAGKRLDLIIVPEPQVMRADAPLRRHGNGFGQHQSRPAGRPAAEMDQVPVIGSTVNA